SSGGGWLASFGLGAIFAVGWSPCIGIILGGILTMAATSSTVAQGALLLVAYTIGLGLPFLLIAAVYDRAPRLLSPLVRHGRLVSLVGGLLVAAIGVAMVFDWLALLPRYFNFNTAVLVTERTDFTHKRERHGVIGPFSGRQLVFAFAAVIVAGIVLVGITTPLGTTANAPGAADPRPTAYILSSPPPVGLKVGALAPEFSVTNDDGSTYQLTDL